jgi:DNA-binding MarR family transcriptional regulator
MASHTSFSADIRTALDAFRQIVQALRLSATDVERRLGVTTAQLFALQQLAAAPGSSVNELAARTFTHQSSVSVVVQRLTARRLIQKSRSPEDGRRVVLTVSESGRRLLRRSPEPAQDRLIAGFAALSDVERRTVAQALADVAATMNGVAGSHKAPPMLFEDATRRRNNHSASRRRRGKTALI